jgi:hypothetical protein
MAVSFHLVGSSQMIETGQTKMLGALAVSNTKASDVIGSRSRSEYFRR